MPKINQFQNITDIENDTKKEYTDKHTPFIHCEKLASRDTPFSVTIKMGNTYAHPDDFDHYISQIALYNKETKLAEANFMAGSLGGQNKKGHQTVTFNIILDRNAMLIAHSYCTKHGIWESSPVEVTIK